VGNRAGLTFTADSWREVLSFKERTRPDLLVVGWYHSHPLYPVLPSMDDLELHQGFFPEPWQCAIIIDPFSGILALLSSGPGYLLPIRNIALVNTSHDSSDYGIEFGYITFSPSVALTQ
jgi:proteasome lid subunit RPN8/RPN11